MKSINFEIAKVVDLNFWDMVGGKIMTTWDEELTKHDMEQREKIKKLQEQIVEKKTEIEKLEEIISELKNDLEEVIAENIKGRNYFKKELLMELPKIIYLVPGPIGGYVWCDEDYSSSGEAIPYIKMDEYKQVLKSRGQYIDRLENLMRE